MKGSDVLSNFSEMLVYLRKRAKLSQGDLANGTGLTRSAISMFELGKRQPEFETLEILADYFNVDMDFLLGRSKGAAPALPDELSEAKRELIEIIKQMPDERVKAVLAILKG